MRTTFAVGRLTPRSAEIVLLDENRKGSGTRNRAPFPGPWKLQALVARLRTRRTSKEGSGARVH